MERKTTPTIEKPDLILTADWHIRETLPPCRTDDFFAEQWRKVKWISDLQKEHDCPILHSGDLFDFWKPSPELLSKTIEHLPKKFLTIYGNHDLPQHSMELSHKSGVHTLLKAGSLSILVEGYHWNTFPNDDYQMLDFKGRKILIWHVMTFQGLKPFPGCKDSPAAGLLRKYKYPDLILTGHNHQSFVEEFNGRLLVNPGCITRQESDQADFKPKVYLYYAKTNTVKALYIPIVEKVVQKPQNVQKIEERNERIDAFISKLKNPMDEGIDINFEKNLSKFISENEIEEDVTKIIYKAIGD